MLLMWRIHSGVAHSLPSVNLGKAEIVGRLPTDDGYEATVSASITDMGTAVASAYLATREALRLYEKRTEGRGSRGARR